MFALFNDPCLLSIKCLTLEQLSLLCLCTDLQCRRILKIQRTSNCRKQWLNLIIFFLQLTLLMHLHLPNLQARDLFSFCFYCIAHVAFCHGVAGALDHLSAYEISFANYRSFSYIYVGYLMDLTLFL